MPANACVLCLKTKGGENMKKSFEEMIAITAILAGIAALGYAYFFVVAKDATMYSLFLLLLGLLSLEVFIGLYSKLKETNEDYARVAMILGVIGAVGSAVHGGYDLANAINPPAVLNADLPSQIDPRGLLAFGITGIAVVKTSWLMSKNTFFPNGLSMLGLLSGILLVIIYLARLTVLDPKNPVLAYPILIEGFIVNPIWYIWLGTVLKKK